MIANRLISVLIALLIALISRAAGGTFDQASMKEWQSFKVRSIVVRLQ